MSNIRASRSGPRRLAGAVLAAVALVSACSSSTPTAAPGGSAAQVPAGAPITLNYAAFFAPSSPHAEAMDYVATEMNKRTNGRVTIERYYSGALCGVNEILPCQMDGRADLGAWLPWRDPQNLPLASVVGVLFVTNNTVAHTRAFDKLAQDNEMVRAEFTKNGLVPLYYGPVGPAMLGTKEPVSSLDWLEGRPIRTTGYFANALGAIGGSPVDLPNSETYESIQRGVIEGFYAVTLDGAVIDQKLHEVTKYWYDLGAGEYANVVTTISQRAFDKLTPDEQATLLEIVDEVREKFWDDYYFPMIEGACQTAIDAGIQSLEIWATDRPAETEKFRAAAADLVKDKWIEQAKAAGAPAEEFFQTYVEAVRAMEKEVGPISSATERCSAQMKGN